MVKLYCHSVLRYLNLLNFQEINCLFSQFLLPTYQMFEEIKNGSTRFSIGEDQICETCHNARMIKVFIHYESNLHILLRLFLIVVSLSMCLFSRTDISFFLYLNSASNVVTIITGITQCKGIRIPESRKFVFVESGIRENFACGILNSRLWNPESAQRIRNPT